MATLTTTGNLSTILAADFNDFWDAYEGAANIYCVTTFNAMELFMSTSDIVPAFGFPTTTELQGSSANAEGDVVIIGTGLLNYDTPGGVGTITSITFDSTSGANSGDSFTLEGSAHWTYDSGFDSGGLASVTIHHGTDVLTITSALKNLVPDDSGNEFTGTVSSLTLTTGGITVTLLGSFEASDLTGTLNSITFTEGANSFTLKGAFDAPTFFDNPNFITVNDLFNEQSFFAGNDIFTINDSSARAWHGYGGADKLTGGANADTLFGDAGNDNLIGLGGNDSLDGGAGVDAMTGGLGNDYYFVDNSLDKAVELVGGGDDTVESTATYVLGANVDDLLLAGSGNINGTGNLLVNVITGNSGNNTLNGGLGADTMIGGGGDDTFIVDNAGDVVTAGSGDDTVVITRTNASLVTPITIHTSDFTGVENLTVTGTGLFNLEGDSGDNILTGNASVNTLTGFGGQDTLDGGLGADILIGGNNDDTYVLDSAGDSITDTGGTDTLIVKLTSGTYTLGADFENLTLFGIASTNGTGNAAANIITGNTGANILNGLAGADSMIGGAGNDTYVVDHAGDAVTESLSGGTDTVRSSVDFDLGTDGANIEKLTLTALAGDIDGTGNALANVITGNEGDNTLDGALGTGIDTLIGGAGDDTYLVDLVKVSGVVKLMSLITEIPGAPGGTDTLVVRSGDLALTTAINGSLSPYLENMDISQTGSNLLNLTGNASNNILTGNAAGNTLNGLGGNDTMIGGDGNDTYIFSSASDVATENSGGGAGNSDTVVIAYATAVPAVLDVADYANIENLKVTGTGLYSLIGDSNANILTGNASVNSMTGGDGDDTYFVGAGDILIEALNEGTDTVMSAITWTLGSNLENLTLTGTGSVKGIGNTLDNVITGNNGANSLVGNDGADHLIGGIGADTLLGGIGDDTLDGGAGADKLTGGADSDTFVIHAAQATSSSNADLIYDFTAGPGGDALDIHDILVGYSSGSVADWVHLTVSGLNTIVSVDSNGLTGGSSFVNIATLVNVTGLNVDQMVTDANLIVT